MAHSSTTLARFPPELLRRICEYLGQLHAPSVLSFALASKSFHSVAKALLFRRLTFTLTTPGRLRRHTRRCTELLRRHHAFDHVRCLVLVASPDAQFDLMRRADDDDQDLKDERNDGEDDDQSVHERFRWNLGPYPTTDWKVEQQRLHGLPDYSNFARRAVEVANRPPVGDADSGAVEDAYRMDSAWAPLADLVRLLPALMDLIYDCPAQFPPCLLQAVHDKLPGRVTRLHLRTFELRMLEGRLTKDAHELALIASPCIHSIWLQDHIVIGMGQRFADVPPGRQVQALEQMMKTEGLAPNLREVCVTQIRQFHRGLLQNHPQTWLPAELAGTGREQHEVTLRHLGLGGGSYVSGVTDIHIQYWNERAALSALQTLELTGAVDER